MNTGRDESKDIEALEKSMEMAEEYNQEYDNLNAVERVQRQEEIFHMLLNSKKMERTAIFDLMTGSKKDLRESFKEYRKNAFEDMEDSEMVQDRYDQDVIERAEELLEEEHILKKVKTVLDHRVAGEDVNKLGLFLQLLTKDTEDPLMIFGIQKQGEGKSYLAKKVIDLFPDHMVERLTDATKSSIYRIAQTEGKDYFDGKIVFFGEIPEEEDDREVFQIFRQLVSEGEVQKRLTLEEGGDMESSKLELEGTPVVISTTVNEGLIDAQDMSRGMAYSPEMSKEQNDKVRSFQNTESQFPEHLLEPGEIEELEKTIECAMDILAEDQVNIQNPFTEDIDNQVPKDTDNIKRDYPKTLKISAEMPTYLYHRQRPKKEIRGEEYTYVTWKDVARGIVINKQFINNMIRGQTESVLDAYKVIKEKVEKVEKAYNDMDSFVTELEIDEKDYFTNKDLEKWMGLASQTSREYTRKLDRMELIYKDTSTKTHRHYLVDNELSETAGVTLSSLHMILASVLEREELGDWLDKYYSFTGLEGSREDLLDKIAFSEEDLPVNVDIGLRRDPNLPTPLYLKINQRTINEATGVTIDKDDSVIMCDFDSVPKSFKKDMKESEEKPSDNQDISEESEESEVEESVKNNTHPPSNQGESEETGEDEGVGVDSNKENPTSQTSQTSPGKEDSGENEENSVIFDKDPEIGEEIEKKTAVKILDVFQEEGEMKKQEAHKLIGSEISEFDRKISDLKALNYLSYDQHTHQYRLSSEGKGFLKNEGLEQVIE
jgi:hypothetical protein